MRSGVIAGLLLVLVSGSARADQAISFGGDGLRVGDATVVSTAIGGAAYDPYLEVVWFETQGTLQAIDLRDARRTPIVIAKAFPAGSFDVKVGEDVEAAWIADDQAVAEIVVGRKPKIIAVTVTGDRVTGAQAKPIQKAKLVGKKWVAGLAKRKARDVPSPHEAATQILAASICDSGNGWCGTASTLGPGPLELVLVKPNTCVLYDPATQRYADPDDTSSWSSQIQIGATPDTGFAPGGGPCDNYLVASDDRSYVVRLAARLCTVGDKGVQCAGDRRYVGLAAPSP